MKISKKSWHYRLNNAMQTKWEQQVERNVFTTCSYIRVTGLSVLGALAAASGLIVMIAFVISMICSTIALPIMLLSGSAIPTIVGPFGTVGWLLLFVMLVDRAVRYICKRFNSWSDDRRMKRISLLQQAAEDRRNGICTIVEFE